MRGSAGQTSRVFQMGADIVIILSVDPTIQMSELRVHNSEVRELSHRKQGLVCIMKPKDNGKNDEDGVVKRDAFYLVSKMYYHDNYTFPVVGLGQKKNRCLPSGETFHSKFVLAHLNYLKITNCP